VTTAELPRTVAAPDLLERPASLIEKITEARAWPPVSFLALAVYAAARYFGTPAGLVPAWVAVLVFAAASLAFGIYMGRTVGGAMALAQEHHAAGGHSDTWGSWRTCVHEAGHWGASVVLGQHPTQAVVGKQPGSGGWCGFRRWVRDPIDNAAVLYAGGMACGSQQGCSYDNNLAAAFLRRAPDGFSKGQARAMARARYALNASAGLRSRVATILHRQGRHS
jgi:hypothetical protein